MMTQARDPERHQVVVRHPEDFDDFWAGVMEELGRWPVDAEFCRDELRSTDRVDVYDVGYTSLDGVRLSAWYACPRQEVATPPYPGLLIVPGYISDPVIPKSWAELGYAAFAVAPRGKARSRSEVDANYPGLLVENSVDRFTYGYRAFYADACRAVDVVAQRPEVDPSRIGVHGSSQGGALTIVLAALRNDLIVCGAAGAPYLCGILDAAQLTTSYPYHEITERLRAHPEERDAIEETLPYFDGLNFAPAITAPMLVYIGLEDDVCPPETGYAVHAALRCAKQLIVTPHSAHDAGAHWVNARVEAFLAKQLQPVPVAAVEVVA
jgi:cephalosporin-C deacetylase